MSKTIDERVVEMRFDNRHFEKNVNTSLNTLDKLKQSLKLKDASKGLENVESAAKKVDFNPLTKAAETVSAKFSALQVVGVTALANITNSAVNAGKNIAKAFTIDPIKTGFQEYETQINAVQTILANTESKGSTLQDVNNALAELNTYADKTIYNFTEMTRNIGTFTAAGVDLRTSVSAIKGIANLAAVSGSNAQQASTAMYQLSQALASGTVKLMDWNSVVNAGMGGQVFQDALKETARIHGVAIDDMIKKKGSFRETLQLEWLTTDILTETLNNFTLAAEEGSAEWENYKKSLMDKGYAEKQAIAILKMANTATDAATKVKTFTQLMDTLKEAAQSGWTKSWEIMIGDFEEAKNFLTDVSDRLGEMIGGSSDARNKMLSEGLSSGWKQLLNAGIADEEGFKETFKSVADAHGTSIDTMISAEKELDNSLTDSEAFQKALKKGFDEGKLSSDMLSESVHKMADKMSNMSDEELKAAGYTSDHVKQINDLSAGLKDGSISMDEFTKKITRTSGRENIIQALWNSFDGLMNIIKPIKEAFRDIFPATTGEQLYSFTERLVTITAKFKDFTEKYAPQIKSTFKGIFSIIKIGTTIIKSIISGIAQLIGKLTGFSGGILDITGSLGDWISGIATSITEANLFGKAIDGIVRFLGKGIDKIKEFTGAIKDKFDCSAFEIFLNILKSIWDAIKKIGGAVGTVFAGFGKALANAFRNGDIKSLLDILNGGLFSTILLGIKKYIKGITDKFDDAVGFVDRIKNILGSVEDSLKSWQQNLKAGTLIKIAVAIGILSASLWVLSSIEPGKLTSSLGAITVLFGELMGSMFLFEKITDKSKGMTKATTTMIGISISVLILASAMKKLSDLDWGQIGRGLTGVLGLMIIVVGAAKILSTGGKKIQKGAMQMVIMAAALKILASVCKDLSKLSWEELAKGVSGITGILLAFAGFQALMKKIQPKKMLTSAASLILIGAAMEIFADVCSKFGKMEWPDLGKAGAAIAGILVIAAGFVKLSSYSSKMIRSSIALVIIGASMEIFADVCNKFGQMKWQDIGKAGVAIAGLLALASGFVLLSGMANGILKSVAALTIIAVAMEIFADVCAKFGQMDWEQLGKAGAAIGGILALAAGFSLLAGLSDGMWKSAAALLIMAAALAIFTPILTTLGNMSWGEIVKGLVAIAGAFAIVGIAGAVLGPLVPSILALSGAIALLGVGCLAAGVGVMAFAAGFTALATAGAAGATAFVAALTVIIVGILELIPQIVGVLTEAVVAFCNVIIQSAPAIGEAIKTLVLTAIDVLVECIPALAEGFLKLILGVLDALAKYTPQIVTKLFEILKGIVESAVEALGSIDPETLLKGIAAMTGLMVALNLMASLAVGAMVGVLAMGAVIAELALVIAAIGALAQIPGLEWLISEGGDFLQKIGTAIGQFIGGIVGGIAEGATSVLPAVASNLSEFMTNITPFIEGAKSIDESAMNGVKALAETILILTGAGILDGITSWLTGGASLDTFASQLIPFGKAIKAFSNEVAGIDGETVMNAANAGKVLSEMAKSLPREGGWFEKLIGSKDLSSFGTKIISFGKSIKSFAQEVAGIDGEAVTNAANAGKVLTEMAKSLPKEGGLWQKIVGGKDLSSFSSKITSFGKAIKSFAQEVTGINTSAITNAALAVKEIINIANSTAGIDFSGLSSFSSSMSKLGKSGFDNFIKAFSSSSGKAVDVGKTLVMNIAKGVSSGIPILTNSINPAIQNMIQSAQSKAEAFANVGTILISKFANSVKNGTNTMKSIMSSTIQSMITSTKSYYNHFAIAGLHLVYGFAKGISDNTFIAEAKAKAMANAAYEAAKKALDEHSPSKKFMKVGAFVVAGFAKGISKNIGDATKAAISMSTGVLEATQDALGINSPSIVFKEEVGRYIVQGIAEGIEKDMSAEEAAEKKAQNIVNAFKKELDKNDLDTETAEKEFELWKLKDGKNASVKDITAKQLKLYNDNLTRAVKQQQLAYDEWRETCAQLGDNSEYAQEAWNKYLDSQIEVQNIHKDIADITKENAEYEKELNEELIDTKYELWEAQHNYASEEEKAAKETEYYNEKLKIAVDDSLKSYQKYVDKVKQFGEESVDAKEAFKTYLEDEKEIADIQIQLMENMREAADRRSEEFDERRESRENAYKLWQLKNDDATDKQKDDRALRDLADQLDENADQRKQLQDDAFEAAMQFGKQSEAYKDIVKQLENLDLADAEARKNIRDIKKNALERENEMLKESINIQSEAADLKYQIWEKTYGRKATAMQKSVTKLALLNEQVITQSKMLEVSRKDYLKAVDDYGKSSNEAQSAYNDFLREQLELANLQSDIADLNEATVEREKNARSDYKKYMERYKDYYLKNGMTLEDLEKDARLTSGYDPNNAVTSMLDKTGKAINDIMSNSKYKDIVSGFSNIGTSYADAVNTGVEEHIPTLVDTTTSMIEQCTNAIKEQKSKWISAGHNLVYGLIEGIKEYTSKAIEAAKELAKATTEAANTEFGIASPSKAFAEIGMYAVSGLAKGLIENSKLSEEASSIVGDNVIDNLRNTIKRISDIATSEIDTQPTIRPVLDLSDVESGTARLNALFSRSQAIRINAGMQKHNVSDSQNSNNSNNGNTYQFTQNNYSPKALSRNEIYRQTRNQFTAMKEALK